MLLGRLGRPQRVGLKTGGRGSRLIVFAVRKRQLPTGARHYVPHCLGLTGLLGRLRDENLRHAVLRWFETLPNLPAGEDIDVLVGDDHLPRMLTILESGPGVQPCDVYSETGLPRSDYRKMPYFPPRLASELLDGAVLHRGLCRVPNPKAHLLSLTYHAVYHKGPSSGVPESAEGVDTAAEHPYPRILADLARGLGERIEVTRWGLDAFLAANSWQPPRDMLLRIGKRNRWVRETLQINDPERPQDRGLVVFVVRERAMLRGGLEKLMPLLEQTGFKILKRKLLVGDEQLRVTHNMRGGNWGRGPWPVSGGPPAAIVVAFDPQPIPLTRKQQKKFPLATNARVLEKGAIRDLFNAGQPAEQHCNALHSSDNGHEAWEYIALAMPEAADEIRRLIAAASEDEIDAPKARIADPAVVKDLTRFGRRTRVEVIEHEGRLAVRKTFKPGCERFCRREEFAMRELSRQVPQIPRLLESGALSVVYPYYDDVLRYDRSSGWLLSVDVARQAIEALERVRAAGYALVDASIDNVLVDRREGLKLIDFEFLHQYDIQPVTLAESYDVAGCPADFCGDLPSGGSKNYRRNWMPYTGLSLESLLHDPAWLQTIKRTIYVALRPQRYWPRRARYLGRKLLAAWTRSNTSQPAIDTTPSRNARRAA
jgi:hypothetical protein